MTTAPIVTYTPWHWYNANSLEMIFGSFVTLQQSKPYPSGAYVIAYAITT
ncbi:MAG: hypothetical protein ACREA4_00025 [Nitrososphaera sp.]